MRHVKTINPFIIIQFSTSSLVWSVNVNLGLLNVERKSVNIPCSISIKIIIGFYEHMHKRNLFSTIKTR
jgi:hypothetical protein